MKPVQQGNSAYMNLPAKIMRKRGIDFETNFELTTNETQLIYTRLMPVEATVAIGEELFTANEEKIISYMEGYNYRSLPTLFKLFKGTNTNVSMKQKQLEATVRRLTKKGLFQKKGPGLERMGES